MHYPQIVLLTGPGQGVPADDGGYDRLVAAEIDGQSWPIISVKTEDEARGGTIVTLQVRAHVERRPAS